MAEQKIESISQNVVFEDVPGVKVHAASPRFKDNVETYLERSWKAVKLLIENADGDPGFAVQRVYFALYNVAITAALEMDFDLEQHQQDLHHHIETGSIPHSQMPLLVQRIARSIQPDRRLGEKKPFTHNAFALTRSLQKIRKTADYMGNEPLSRDKAKEYMNLTQNLTNEIRRHACGKSS